MKPFSLLARCRFAPIVKVGSKVTFEDGKQGVMWLPEKTHAALINMIYAPKITIDFDAVKKRLNNQ